MTHCEGTLLSAFTSLFLTISIVSPILVYLETLGFSISDLSIIFFKFSPSCFSLSLPTSMLVDFGSEILIPLLPPISLLYFNNPSLVVPSKSFSLCFNLLFSFSIYSYENINCLYFYSRFCNDCFTGTTTSKSLPALTVWTLKANSKSLAVLEILSTSLPRSLASYSYFLASLSAIAVSVIASSNYFLRFLDSRNASTLRTAWTTGPISANIKTEVISELSSDAGKWSRVCMCTNLILCFW